MLTKSKRGRPGLILGVLTVLLSSSGLVQAQQSGLFPLHPIKRQREERGIRDDGERRGCTAPLVRVDHRGKIHVAQRVAVGNDERLGQ